ncbi:MAG: D-alanyl-D-alanine carboxypeptidase family protein, partial [Oscillospiraceae bacterium]
MLKQINKVTFISALIAFAVSFTSISAAGLTRTDIITASSVPLPEITAKTGVLMESSTGTILFEKESHQKLAPASVTKIMTMLLVIESIESGKISFSDEVTCSELASSMGGTQIWLKPTEQMSVEDLLKATAVASANDAAMALAEYVGGSCEGFVAMMNNKAKQLGMNDTNFVNPTGLDAESHLTSAYDIALMSCELIKHKDITRFTTIWMDSLRGGKTQLVNTNKLIRFYKGATGLKTGTTDKAGSCVSISATRDNLSLVSVVMGCATSKDRFTSARQLLDFGFNNFTSFKPEISTDTLKPIKVIGGTEKLVNVNVINPAPLIIPKGYEEMITQKITTEP